MQQTARWTGLLKARHQHQPSGEWWPRAGGGYGAACCLYTGWLLVP